MSVFYECIIKITNRKRVNRKIVIKKLSQSSLIPHNMQDPKLDERCDK
jgi:hypothetical protein